MCSFLQPSIIPSLFSPRILLSTLFSNTFGLCSSLNGRDQVSHQYETKGKITVLYILMYDFRQQTRRQKVPNWIISITTRI
jgi:hypothetical protein